MARINIEEKWKTDPRRNALAKSIGPRAADGMLVEIAWLLWSHKGKGIPLAEFQFIENHEDWLACGLGKIDGDWVRIAGSEQYKEFFEKQRSNGLLGAPHGVKGGRPRKPPKTPKNGPLTLPLTLKEEEYTHTKEKNGEVSECGVLSEKDIYLSLPIITRDKIENKYDAEFVRDGMGEMVLYHSSDPLSCHWPPMRWGKLLTSWLFEKTRREKQKNTKIDTFCGVADV